MHGKLRVSLFILLLAAGRPLAQEPPAVQPASQPASRPGIEALTADLASDSPETRAAAVEGLLELGAKGRQVLTVEAARLTREGRAELIRRVTTIPRAAQVALEEHARWQKAVKDFIRVLRRTPTDEPEKIEAMLKQMRDTTRQYDTFHEALTAAVQQLAPIERGLARLNDYEQARAKADRTYRPHEHKVHELVAAAELTYPVAFDAVLAEQRKLDEIDKIVREKNALLKDEMEQQEYAVIDALNSYRRKMGMVSLTLNKKLNAASRQHSKEMYDLSYFSHTSPVPAYASFLTRAIVAGYTGARNVGENIAVSRNAETVTGAWLYSRPHHLQMLNPTHREVGIGRTGRYWTEMFGLRSRNPWDGSDAPPPDITWLGRAE